MSRWVTALAAAVVFALACAAPAAQPDPIKAKVDKARAAFEAELTTAEKAVTEGLDKAEGAARQRGDKKALDKLKTERELFELTGVPPKSLAASTNQKVVATYKTLEATYAAAVKEYTKASMDAEAAAAEKERVSLKETGAMRPRYFLVVNKNSELALAAAKEKGEQGSGLNQSKRTEADNQLWSLVPAGAADVYRLRNKASGLVASVGGSRQPGHNLTLEKDDGDGSRWVLEREGFHFLFQNVNSKLHFTVAEASKEVGMRVLQWQKGDQAGDHYRWNLIAAKGK